ncbi:MAG: META domain-containing protein [Dehalococcoidales bacterium]|nr:META domain-containing protein [Dehalococcoidales bacterium]
MKKTTVALMLIAAALLAFTLTGCSGSSESKLEDIKWTLESYGAKDNPEPVLEGSVVTATFNSEEDTVTGKAGCNSYFGGYELKDGLSTGMLGSTEMYCMEPEGIMDQEQEYLTLLGQADDYSIDGDTLEIYCGDNILIFTAAEVTE